MSRRHPAVAAAVRPVSNKRSRRSSRSVERAPTRQPEPLWSELEQAFFDAAPSEHDPVPAPECFDDLDDLPAE